MQVLKNLFGLNKKIAASEIAVKDEDGNGVTLDDYLKKQGPNVGTAGEDGTTFIPSVSSDGTLSWSNNGGLENPDSVNIKGPQGESGATGPQGVQGVQGETGQDGREIELQVTTTYIQWRYVGDTTWNNLIALSNLKGSKGDQGEQGVQGIQGPKGDNGKDGVTPNITVGTTTTLAAGSSATVTKRGTTENPIFDFGIPKGVDGDNATGLVETVLYENSSGSNSSVTSNYFDGIKFIDVFYKTNFGDLYVDFKRVNLEHTNNSRRVPIIFNYYDKDNNINYQVSEFFGVIVNESILGLFRYSQCRISTNTIDGSQTFDTSTRYFYITKIVGYK